MSIGTYAELQTALQAFSKRDDLSAQMADFVTLGEERINIDMRLRKQVVNSAISTVGGVQGVTLPTDWLETENITVSSSSPARNLIMITPEQMDERFPNAYQTGTPEFATVVGNTLQLGPTPDGVYTISMDYYQRWNIASTSTNWLLTTYPGIYLAACMAELCAYTMDSEWLQYWTAKFKAESDALQNADDAAIRSGSQLRVRVL